MNENKKETIEEILGFELTTEEIKKASSLSPKIKKDLEVWASKNSDNILSLQIKKCFVEDIDLTKTYEDFEKEYAINDESGDDDEDFLSEATEKYKEYLKEIKKNEEKCPHFRECPLFQSKMLPKGEKCPLEMINTSNLKRGIYKELDIKEDDFSDKITANHLISIENIAQRLLSSLSIQSPVVNVVTVNKNGSKTYDTKINENLNAYQMTMNMADKLRKNLILDRESKMKNKKIESEINERTVKENLKNKLTNGFFDVNSSAIAEAVILEEENKKDELLNLEG